MSTHNDTSRPRWGCAVCGSALGDYDDFPLADGMAVCRRCGIKGYYASSRGVMRSREDEMIQSADAYYAVLTLERWLQRLVKDRPSSDDDQG